MFVCFRFLVLTFISLRAVQVDNISGGVCADLELEGKRTVKSGRKSEFIKGPGGGLGKEGGGAGRVSRTRFGLDQVSLVSLVLVAGLGLGSDWAHELPAPSARARAGSRMCLSMSIYSEWAPEYYKYALLADRYYMYVS